MFGLAQVDRLNGDVNLFMTDAYEGSTDYRVRNYSGLGLHMRHESQKTATVRSERGK